MPCWFIELLGLLKKSILCRCWKCSTRRHTKLHGASTGNFEKAQVVDKDTGRVDLRYNPLSVDEDYYLPVRGAESGTKIDTLAGGANATAIEDVEYIQKKLFAALKFQRLI